MPRQDLPIFELEHQLVSALKEQSRLIIQAPTGSGKSTQVPQILFDRGLLGKGEVVILQPRRLATRLLAARVASEREVKLGQEVGYQIRFENITSASHPDSFRNRRHSVASAYPESTTDRSFRDPVRRIPRTPSLWRHHARSRPSTSSYVPPRSETRGHVRDA